MARRLLRSMVGSTASFGALVWVTSCAEIAGIEPPERAGAAGLGGQTSGQGGAADGGTKPASGGGVSTGGAISSGGTTSAACGDCTVWCEQYGLTTGPCVEGECECGGVLSPECAIGANSFCSCVAGGCTDEDRGLLYVLCYTEAEDYADFALCWADVADCDEGEALCGFEP